MRIVTLGYGQRSLDEVLELLRGVGAKFLVDVRSTPYSSYRKEFDRERLMAWAPENDLRYVYLGDRLGGASVRAAQSEGPSEAFEAGLAQISKAAIEGKSLALMCGCLVPDECHRRLLGEPLARLGIELVHLDRDGSIRTQGEIEERVNGGQQALF